MCFAPETPTAAADVRRWFWARKPGSSFLLRGFPANRAQALVFDEWLDARQESLSACLFAVASRGAAEAGIGFSEVFDHYQARGLTAALPAAS